MCARAILKIRGLTGFRRDSRSSLNPHIPNLDSLGTHDNELCGFGTECTLCSASSPELQAAKMAAKASCRRLAGCGYSGSLLPAGGQRDLCQGLVSWPNKRALGVGPARYPLCFTATTDRGRPHHLRVCNVGAPTALDY